MAKTPGYSHNYPQAGDIALLCEGDIVGYESSILKRWIGQNVGSSPLVDVWPCGTSEAIYGMSDAIGRSRPLIVIEDRDFRTKAEASDDSAKRQKDRERRAVMVLMWRAWSRAEIENYFLEKKILSKVMMAAFECTDMDLQEAINDVLKGLLITQSALCTFYRIRRRWKLCDPDLVLRSNAAFRARWDDVALTIVPPDKNEIEKQLKANVEKWRGTSQFPQSCALSWPDVQKEFDERCAKWSMVEYNSPDWVKDWAGKEILQSLCRWMSARFGWHDRSIGKRVVVKWGAMSKAEQGSLDREIENTLRPEFVKALADDIGTTDDKETHEEWQAILAAVRSWAAS